MKYLIIANGPFLDRNIIQAATQDRVVIALDGAADRLANIGVEPDVIIGDFDSIDAETWGIDASFRDGVPKKTKGVWAVRATNQDKTDLVKSIEFCDSPSIAGLKPATEIDILCALDGKFDHTIGNTRALRGCYKKDRVIRLHNSTHSIIFIKNDSITIVNNHTEKQVAIISMPEAWFTSTGLKWNGDQYHLYPGHDSTCNELIGHQAVIQVKGEAVVMMPRV